MFELDAFHLARIQFAFTVSFHILFPAITIGLASYLVVLEGMWLRTKNDVWRSLYHFWLKILPLTLGWAWFPGWSWPISSAPTGADSPSLPAVLPALLTYEVLTAFFLEAGFLGVMLFGWNKVGPGCTFFHLHGGARHADVHLLDPRLQQLDAYAAGLYYRKRTGHPAGLAGDRL
jgi:cytochrome d ubiquinol oxidase subunit I